MHFKKEFVNKLKTLIPENINKFNLKYPQKQDGYIRFDNYRLQAVYLEGIKDKYDNNIILKFKYRDFHYVPADYIFSDVYICGDTCNEYRYDKNLNLNAVYLKDISILPSLSKENKLHMLDILIEWQKYSKVLGKDNYISAYQIEKDNIKVKNPYIVFNSPIPKLNAATRKSKIIDKMLDNFNLNNTKYFQKCKIRDDEIIKNEVIYLIIENKQNTNNDG